MRRWLADNASRHVGFADFYVSSTPWIEYSVPGRRGSLLSNLDPIFELKSFFARAK
jgi:hypothetical protein